MDKPLSSCPGCNKFVDHSDNGVVCTSCVAYWHYECANVTEDDIAKLGDKDFYCSSHTKDVGGSSGSQLNKKNSKVEPYSLNMKSCYKKLLQNLSSEFSYEKKDAGKQYVITLNTATYLIMLSKIVEMGESAGLSIKKNYDLREKETKAQFDLVVSQKGLQVPLTMTWFHTTTNVLIQAKGKRKERGWSDKLDVLEGFVNSTLTWMVNQVEKSAGYSEIKENVHQEISNATSLNTTSENEGFTVEGLANQCIGTTTLSMLHEVAICQERNGHVTSMASKEDQPMPSQSSSPASLPNCEEEGAEFTLDDQQQAKSSEIHSSLIHTVHCTHNDNSTSTPVQVRNKSVCEHVNNSTSTPVQARNETVCEIGVDSEEYRLRNEIEQLKKLYEEEQVSLKACKQEMKNQDEDRKGQLQKKNREINRLTEKNDKLKEEKIKLSSEASEKEKQRKTLETKLCAQKKDLLSTKQKLKTLEDHQLVLQTTIDKQINTISSQKLLINEQELSLNTHFSLAASFMEEVEDNGVAEEDDDSSFSCEAALENSFQTKKSTAKLREVLLEQRKKINSLQEENTGKDEKLAQVESSLHDAKEKAKVEQKEASKEISSLKNTLHQLETLVAESKAASNDVNTKYSDMCSLAEKFKLWNSDLRSKVESLEQENKILSSRDEETNSELVQQMQKQIQDKTNDIESLNSYYAALEKEAETLRIEKVAWLKERKCMDKEISAGKAKLLESDQKAQSASLARAAAEAELNSAYQLKDALKAKKEDTFNEHSSPKTSISKEGETSNPNPSHVCLFELKEAGTCIRKKKCKFEHNIPMSLRNSTDFIQKAIDSHSQKMAFCAVEFVRKGTCNAEECRYNHVIEESNLRRRRSEDHCYIDKKNSDKVCYKELAQKGSCPFGKDKCHFSHDIPESLRSDTVLTQKIMEEKKEKQALCVNEYIRKGGCNKKMKCRFNHEITEEQREDLELREKMKVKLDKMSCNNVAEKSVTQVKRGSNEFIFSNNISKEVAELRKIVLEIRDRHF